MSMKDLMLEQLAISGLPWSAISAALHVTKPYPACAEHLVNAHTARHHAKVSL